MTCRCNSIIFADLVETTIEGETESVLIHPTCGEVFNRLPVWKRSDLVRERLDQINDVPKKNLPDGWQVMGELK